jgi:hypothetical protein
MKTKLTVLIILGLSYLTNAQDTLQDPYVNIKSFTTLEYGLGITYTDSRNADLGNYKLVKGEYSPSFNMGLFYTKTNILKDPTFIMNIKTGLFTNNNYTNVIDSLGKELTFSELNLTLPIMIGIRLPVNYNRPQDRFYKAVNLNIGGYVSLPILPSLYNSDEKYSESNGFLSDYIKFGFIAEFVFTAVNKEGKGHRIGIRTIADLGSAVIFSNEKYGIQPTYGTIGLFYNFITL